MNGLLRIAMHLVAGLVLLAALAACEPASGPRPEPERSGYS